jgi:thiol-disulfide isomerase/thioredoxin
MSIPKSLQRHRFYQITTLKQSVRLLEMGYGEIKNRSDFTAALDKTEDSKNIVIIDCFTTWCKICKAIAPKIDELNRKYGEDKNVLWYVG